MDHQPVGRRADMDFHQIIRGTGRPHPAGQRCQAPRNSRRSPIGLGCGATNLATGRRQFASAHPQGAAWSGGGRLQLWAAWACKWRPTGWNAPACTLRPMEGIVVGVLGAVRNPLIRRRRHRHRGRRLAGRRRPPWRWICSITFNAPPKACTVWPRRSGRGSPSVVAVIAPAKSAGRELDVALDILEKLGGRLPEEQAKIVQALHKDLTAIHTTLSETQSAEAEPQANLTEGERWTKAITGGGCFPTRGRRITKPPCGPS